MIPEITIEIQLELFDHGAKKSIKNLIKELRAKTDWHIKISDIPDYYSQELAYFKAKNGILNLRYRFFEKQRDSFSNSGAF